MEYPYTFEVGTKAVGNEVNSNFETVGNQVDTNTNAISDINTNLENKADLSLSNLNETGLDAFANKDASNFNSTGTTYLSGLGMPSTRYIDLTLGASGTTYTAPANGWVDIMGTSTATNPSIFLNSSIHTTIYSSWSGVGLNGSLPVKKGENFAVVYSLVSIKTFRFVYAEGVPSA